MYNFKSFAQIKNETVVEEWYCGKKGLEIYYTIGEKDLYLLATPEQAAPLLKTLGLIEDYSGAGELVTVEVACESYGYEPVTRQMTWEEFMSGYDLSQHDALVIAAHLEDKKQVDKWAEDMRSLPEILKTI